MVLMVYTPTTIPIKKLDRTSLNFVHTKSQFEPQQLFKVDKQKHLKKHDFVRNFNNEMLSFNRNDCHLRISIASF